MLLRARIVRRIRIHYRGRVVLLNDDCRFVKWVETEESVPGNLNSISLSWSLCVVYTRLEEDQRPWVVREEERKKRQKR